MQRNGNMFSAEFFPTPRAFARRMLAKISKDAKYFLEPSAGKGDLADVIRRPITYEEFKEEHPEYKHERFYGYAYEDKNRRVNIDVIEPHPELAAVLRSKEYTVVGYDWLDYGGISYYDAIIMNPPFSNGDAHLLKAWDFLHNGEIVCLLNRETIDNPYTEDRKRLTDIIAAAGQVEYLGTCFDTAERRTNVEVAMVYLKKTAPDDTADMWASEAKRTSEKVYDIEVGDDINFIAIRDNLGNMEHWYNMANQHFVRGIEQLRRAALYMSQNKVNDHHYSDEDNFGKIAAMALSNTHSARAEFLLRHRKLAWKSVFTQMEFGRWLDSKQQERFMKDVERDATIPFTADNIKNTLENVFLSRTKLFDESVANVFDELCSHAVENGSGPVMPSTIKGRRSEGWKTNDSYKVNERLVFPWGCRLDYNGRVALQYSGDSTRIYSDLDRILCVLDGQPFDKCFTVGAAINKGPQAGALTESEYFEIRCFKKGTVHLKWKRKDLLDRFNQHAAAGKLWIGERTQQYRPTPKSKRKTREELNYKCRTTGCDYVDGICSQCQGEDVDSELAKIECELCRSVYEHTGEQNCPIHPKAMPAIEQPKVLRIEGSAHPVRSDFPAGPEGELAYLISKLASRRLHEHCHPQPAAQQRSNSDE